MLNRWKRLLALLASVAVLFSLYTALSRVPEIHKAFWKGE